MTLVGDSPEDAPPAVTELATRAAAIERYLQEIPMPAGPPPAQEQTDAA
jgi:hypothetical protein